jgi:glycosyltransferase involved in cell wall biosynthesis
LYCVNEVFPLIQQQFPDVKLQLVGANPVPTVQQLASEHVEVTGFVESVTEYLAQAAIALAPVTYGSGIQIKVLEAFQTGTPLVATTAALRGLDVRDGQEVLIGDSPSAFAAAVNHLLMDAALRTKIGQAGRHYVERHHDLRMTTQHLLTLYQQVITAKNRAS